MRSTSSTVNTGTLPDCFYFTPRKPVGQRYLRNNSFRFGMNRRRVVGIPDLLRRSTGRTPASADFPVFPPAQRDNIHSRFALVFQKAAPVRHSAIPVRSDKAAKAQTQASQCRADHHRELFKTMAPIGRPPLHTTTFKTIAPTFWVASQDAAGVRSQALPAKRGERVFKRLGLATGTITSLHRKVRGGVAQTGWP